MRPTSNSQSHDVEAPLSLPTFRLTCEAVPVEAWIAVNGKDVPHYASQYDENKKEVSCWIESEAGKSFSINYSVELGNPAMGIKVFLDGALSGEFLMLPNTKERGQMACVLTSQTEGQSLTFAQLELTDDDTYLDQPLKSKAVGEIRLVIDKKSSFQETELPVAGLGYELPPSEKVHERLKKGHDHQIRAGPKTKMANTTVYHATSAGVLATFVIRYRTRAMLQANGIIPSEPTPSVPQDLSRSTSPSLPVKRELSEVQSDDDEDDTNERETALLAELEQIRQKKRAKNSGGNIPRKKIKVEAVVPKFYFKPGEVIDLTDDTPKAKATPNHKLKRKGRQVKKEVVDLTL